MSHTHKLFILIAVSCLFALVACQPTATPVSEMDEGAQTNEAKVETPTATSEPTKEPEQEDASLRAVADSISERLFAEDNVSARTAVDALKNLDLAEDELKAVLKMMTEDLLANEETNAEQLKIIKTLIDLLVRDEVIEVSQVQDLLELVKSRARELAEELVEDATTGEEINITKVTQARAEIRLMLDSHLISEKASEEISDQITEDMRSKLDYEERFSQEDIEIPQGVVRHFEVVEFNGLYKNAYGDFVPRTIRILHNFAPDILRIESVDARRFEQLIAVSPLIPNIGGEGYIEIILLNCEGISTTNRIALAESLDQEMVVIYSLQASDELPGYELNYLSRNSTDDPMIIFAEPNMFRTDHLLAGPDNWYFGVEIRTAFFVATYGKLLTTKYPDPADWLSRYNYPEENEDIGAFDVTLVNEPD